MKHVSRRAFVGALLGAVAAPAVLPYGALARGIRIDPFVGLDVRELGELGADDGPLIKAAIDAANAIGPGVPVRLWRAHNIGTTIPITKGNTRLIGFGSDENHGSGTLGSQAGTLLKWVGVSSGKMITMASPAGGQVQAGGGITGIYFRADNGLAGKGLEITNWRGAFFDDLFFEEFSANCIHCLTDDTLAETAAFANNRFGNIKGRQYLYEAPLLELDGDTSSNCNFNTFAMLNIAHYDGPGVVFKNSDNNIVHQLRAFRASGGTGDALVLHGSDVSAAQCARGNLFYQVTNNAPIVAKGTASYAYPSNDNRIDRPDHDNGSVQPTIEAGATLWYNWKPQPWTPSVAAVSGAITTYDVQEENTYYTMRKHLVSFTVTVYISDNGSGATAINLGLPWPAARNFTVAGRESAGSNGLVGVCSVTTDPSILRVQRAAAGAYPNTSPTYITVSGEYERA